MTSEMVPTTTGSVNTLKISLADPKKGVVSAKADGAIGLGQLEKSPGFHTLESFESLSKMNPAAF